MNKYAAEKIASEYYNLGIQLALQGAGRTKTASRGRLATALGLGAVSPAALTHLNLGGGQTGINMLKAIKSIDPRQGFDLAKIKGIGTGISDDASAFVNNNIDTLTKWERAMLANPTGKKVHDFIDELLGIG